MAELTAEQLAIVRSVLATFLPDVPVWAFGSRVRGTAGPFSDLDLAILAEQPLDPALRAALVEAFSESNLPFRVDVVEWAHASEGFRQIIQAQHVALHPAPSR